MSQPVGYQYKSRIPTLSDDADIVEALKVYHYGVDDWTTEPIPDDSIEGNFRTLNTAVTNIQSQLSSLNYVSLVSQTSSPNIVTAQSTTTTPLALRAIASQTSPLLSFQNSSSVSVGSVSTGGFVNVAGYATIGSATQSTTTGVNIFLSNASHKGIVINATSGQSANLQEWVVNGSVVARVSSNGVFYSGGIVVGGATGGGTDKIFFENNTTITSNYTITTSTNAGTFGPITINTGVTVTVPSGSVWTIV